MSNDFGLIRKWIIFVGIISTIFSSSQTTNQLNLISLKPGYGLFDVKDQKLSTWKIFVS